MTLNNINQDVEKLYESKERPKSLLVSPNKGRTLVEILKQIERKKENNQDKSWYNF